ncbi:MAG: hypothetical protein IJH39_06200 [Clostridia bacterium]|nr:hypothetical protein [Clostridia bacterium]
MFTSFKNAFKKDDKMVYKIPQIILDNLNNTLPDGFEYVQIDNDICTIMPKSKNVNIKADLKCDNIKSIKNAKEVSEYLYRTQQEAEIISDYIELNGVKFKVNDLLKMPLRNSDFSDLSGKLILKPSPFPKPFKLLIGYGEMNIEMEFQRQPYADLHKSLFKSIGKESLIIKYIIDEEAHSMTVNVSINIGKAESTSEIVEISNIYKCFMNGRGRIAGVELKNGFENRTEEDGLDSLIEFWKKVDLLSNKLGILFNPQNNILKRDSQLIDRLYRCLIEDKAFREICNLENIEVVGTKDFDKNQLIEKDGIELQFLQGKVYELFDAEVGVYKLTSWYNIKVKSVELMDKKNFKYRFLIDKDTDKTMFRIVKYFLNKEDAEEYRRNLPRSIADLQKIELI